MHSYEKRFNVQCGWVSHYVNTWGQVWDLIKDNPDAWVNEGYADYSDYEYGTEIIRRTSRNVLRTEVEFEVARAEVQHLIKRLA